jgi:hypothetical protein
MWECLEGSTSSRRGSTMDAVAVEVIGGDEELVSIAGFLDSVEAGPAALVLSGEPGIGKTMLWELGVEEAHVRFGRVLVCRAAEAEAALSFSGLSELLTGVFDEVRGREDSP